MQGGKRTPGSFAAPLGMLKALVDARRVVIEVKAIVEDGQLLLLPQAPRSHHLIHMHLRIAPTHCLPSLLTTTSRTCHLHAATSIVPPSTPLVFELQGSACWNAALQREAQLAEVDG